MLEIKVEGCLELFGQEENVEIISVPTIEILYDDDLVATSGTQPSLRAKTMVARLAREAYQQCMSESGELDMETLVDIINEGLPGVELQDSRSDAIGWHCSFEPRSYLITTEVEYSNCVNEESGYVLFKFLNQAISNILDGKNADASLRRSGLTKYNDWLEYFNFVVEKYFPYAGLVSQYDKVRLPNYRLLKDGMMRTNSSLSCRVVIAGETGYFKTLNKLKQYLEGAGATVQPEVGRNTDFLICNYPAGYSDEVKKAKEFGAKIISEEDFLKKVLGANATYLYKQNH